MPETAASAIPPGWWDTYADMLPPAFVAAIALENAATAIRAYEPRLIPGLLQTPHYAQAVMRSTGLPADLAAVDRGMALRTTRQAVLARPDPPTYRVILDQAALQRPAVSPVVMAGQYDRLLRAAAQPTVELQVLPLSAGPIASACFPFTILDPPGTAFVETLHGAELIDEASVVARYAAQFDLLGDAALSPAESADLIRGLYRPA